MNVQSSIQPTGRFPENDIISLLTVNRRFNLAESTANDLSLYEILNLEGCEDIRELRLGYGTAQGYEQLRQEVATLSQIAADYVLTTNGATLALFLLAIELCRPNDEVIIFTPCFPPSRNALLGSGLKINEVQLLFDEDYEVKLSKFERALSAKTKLVSLATPQNPSGVATPSETISAILAIMKRVAPDAWLFIDETYSQTTFGRQSAPQSYASFHPKIITAASISKSFGAPGLRVGWMTVPDRALLERLMVAKMNVVLSTPPLNEILAAHILRNRERILKPRQEMLEAALTIIEEWQKRNSDLLLYVRPSGGALCCIKLKETVFDDTAVIRFWHSLENYDLQLAPGSWFGESDRIFRLGFGYLPIAELKGALSKLESLLHSIAKAEGKA